MIVQWRAWQARPQAYCWCLWRRDKGGTWACAERYPSTLGGALQMMAPNPRSAPAHMVGAQERLAQMRAILMFAGGRPTKGTEMRWRTWCATGSSDCWVVSRMGEGGRWVDQGLYPQTLGHAAELMMEREQRAGSDVVDCPEALARSEQMFSELTQALAGCGVVLP